MPMAEQPIPLGALERLPTWAICIPLVVQWLGLSLRHSSLTLPSVANAGITAGGLVGEGKAEYFRAMGPVARAATATWCALRPGPGVDEATVDALLARHGLAFPLVAKPDLGMCGYGVRKLADHAALASYLTDFPRGQTVILQAYIADEGEAGIFYARRPGAAQGRLLGLALRSFPRVVGDGHRSVAELIAADPRVGRVERGRHAPDYAREAVPAAGEVLRLSTIGSTRVGGLYQDGSSLITPALTAAVERLAQDIAGFHIGRLDVRFASVAGLSAGQGLTIMEVNGAGSEAIQAWDPALSLAAAFRIIFGKQRELFAIGAARRAGGAAPISAAALLRLFRLQRRLIGRYPASS